MKETLENILTSELFWLGLTTLGGYLWKRTRAAKRAQIERWTALAFDAWYLAVGHGIIGKLTPDAWERELLGLVERVEATAKLAGLSIDTKVVREAAGKMLIERSFERLAQAGAALLKVVPDGATR